MEFFGVTRTAIFGAILSCIAYTFRFIFQDGSPLIMGIGLSIYQFGGGLLTGTVLLLIFTSREYGIRKTKIDNEAILMAGFSVSYKIGMAIGGALLGYIMPASYVAQAETQTSEVQAFFFNCSTLFPAICYGICIAACIMVYVLEKSMKKEN